MQKFTRALTREIEVAGERLAVTLSGEGLSVRPVGSRRQPYCMSWAAWVTACTQPWAANYEPTPEEAAKAVEAMKAGKVVSPGAKAAPAETSEEAPKKDAAPTVTGSARQTAGPAHEPSAKHDSAPPAAGGVPPLLARLDKWLAAHRAHYQKGLLPGATPGDIDQLEKEIGCLIPDELRAWLTWHNGQNADTVGALEGRWIPMNTKEIAETKKERDAHPTDAWQDKWVPFLDDDRGNYLAIDTGAPGHPVREVREGHSENAVVAPSLTRWLEGFVEALEQGKYHEDPERGTFFRS
jgi:cell wall assembly regulator SMI1